jgi:surfactin family lipopeptide synthetase A
MDFAKRFYELSPNKQALLALRLESQTELLPSDEDAGADKRLIAYLVVKDGQTPNADQVRSFLKRQLPAFTVPDSFVFTNTLPVTPNGKIDRKALAAQESSHGDLDETYVAPRTDLEEEVAGIWAEVLRVERVGINDNFFDLGGHSLLATRLISRIRESFGVNLPLRSLFESPTVAGQVVAIVQRQVEQVDNEELSALLASLE